ncbi:uncharacterized protein si:dkey-261l7.2 [Neolamprologus brichardi]|uniref:uncharacterized protein si:dkey-261l7.2 n=1 Tax=Neolamprologus brichardi TaxID=32507 RepID=UPI001643F6B3|nr:uncharacterized protein si:dkey-261l7.2 [Neolamprologus brichardi]
MPVLRASAVLQIALLLSAVPAQYFISRWSGSSAAQRYHATTRLLRIWREWRKSYMNVTAWSDWTSQQMSKAMSLVGLGQEDQAGQGSPPLETMLFDNDLGFFGEYNDDDGTLLFDTRAEKTPHYKVIFGGPGPSSVIVAYLPQTQLERITGMRPDIPTLENYFTHFNGKRFVMQPWLRELYPEDEEDDEGEDF